MIRLSGSSHQSPVIEHTELGGNLMRIFDRATGFIRRYVDLWDARPPRSAHVPNEDDPVPARANYPRDAVIEALTNLLVHRDYALVGSSSRVLIFDDRIEFINPSRTEGTRKKAVDYGAATRINPRLHHILTRDEYGLETARRGIPALRRAHYVFTRREPRISLLGDEFRLELCGI